MNLHFIVEDLEELSGNDAEENQLIHILDKDLERVIAEATKLQNQVLESIIGNNQQTIGGGGEPNGNDVLNETSEMMTDAEKQIRIHQSEKETFSKGIASIIYKSGELDTKGETRGENHEEKNVSVDEIIEKSETILYNSDANGSEDNEGGQLETSQQQQNQINNFHETSVEEENANHQKISHSNGNAAESVKSQHPSKNNGKKGLNGNSKKGSRFTVIGGQKVDLNSDKPQYLKLTLEQIQQLAMQQRSGN